MSDDWKQMVQGYDEAIAAFDYLSTTVKEEMFYEGLAASTHALETEMKSRSPVLTGNLKMKIVSKLLPELKNGAIKTVIVGASIEGRRPKKGEVDRPAYYALFIEKGYMAGERDVRAKADTFKEYTTKAGRKYTRGSASRKATYSAGARFIAPRPFVKPTGDVVYPQIPEFFHRALENAIAKMSIKVKK